ncbi:hypothetical protein EDD15DRAFT_2367207 [Pisolithus albus]|nr:hypothetical protein EDD15DRAFT_2367207 [Pisolithus albus]
MHQHLGLQLPPAEGSSGSGPPAANSETLPMSRGIQSDQQPAATRPQTRQSRRAQTQVPSSSEQAQQQPAVACPPPATFEEALARCPPVPAPAQQGTNATAAHMPNRQGDSANQPVTPAPPATTPVPAVPTAGEGVEGPPPPTPAAYEAIIAALYEQLNNLCTHAQPQPDVAVPDGRTPLVANASVIDQVRAAASAPKEEGKRVVLPPIQPGHKASALCCDMVP